MIQINLQNRKRLTDLETNPQIHGCLDTPLDLKWITNNDILHSKHMELCSVLCGSQGRRGVWGRMDTRICVAESLHCSPETTTTLLIGCTPKQNKK